MSCLAFSSRKRLNYWCRHNARSRSFLSCPLPPMFFSEKESRYLKWSWEESEMRITWSDGNKISITRRANRYFGTTRMGDILECHHHQRRSQMMWRRPWDNEHTLSIGNEGAPCHAIDLVYGPTALSCHPSVSLGSEGEELMCCERKPVMGFSGPFYPGMERARILEYKNMTWEENVCRLFPLEFQKIGSLSSDRTLKKDRPPDKKKAMCSQSLSLCLWWLMSSIYSNL